MKATVVECWNKSAPKSKYIIDWFHDNVSKHRHMYGLVYIRTLSPPPAGISDQTFRCLPHPAAEANRNRIWDVQALSDRRASSGLPALAICAFSDNKMQPIDGIIDDVSDRLRALVGGDDTPFESGAIVREPLLGAL